jgi:pyruvate dehydrogenase E1 component
MFGFQRVGDLAWAAGDMQARGFLIGGTAGRTTLAGEGLQHQDGHSHLLAATIPNCVSYDPAFAYELTVIVQDGIRRMYQAQENVFYYLTVMNENYLQPAMPKGVEEGIVRGIYCYQKGGKRKQRVQLLGSGTILREVIAAAELLEKDFQVSADVWSVTSFNELKRDGQDVERWNMLHPEDKPRTSYVTDQLKDQKGPVIAATDYMRSYAEQIRPYIQCSYSVLGTDGFGRSDMRSQLRKFFEVNRYYVAVAALKALVDEGEIKPDVVTKAMKKYKIDPDKPNPAKV